MKPVGGTNRDKKLYGKLRKAVPGKATLRLIKGQARRALGHTGTYKV